MYVGHTILTWQQKMSEIETDIRQHPRCPNCGQPENIVWVHGHGQCAYCKMNTAPCCDGETCDPS